MFQKTRTKYFVSGLLCLIVNTCFSQKQTVRGTVVDNISQSSIPGAIIKISGLDSVIQTVSDENGKFNLSDVPVGSRTIEITAYDYKPVVMQNVTVNAGKELVLTINMEEDLKKINEVVITAKVDKNKPLNELSTVSTRTFSVEETQKFAAAVNDPARMATSFAGVVAAGDGNNHISIRGNSPNGLLWRMEGVEIPNPNHFSNVGTAGGGISILSAQLLSNSDFSTGAFAAEYGNALSGVFDLRLRKGNNEKREYTIQLGVLGMDVATEGPFKKGYEGSYLINYRYSTLNILGKIGIPIGDANTNFQDLSFNIYLPAKKLGKFTVFGFGGLSYQTTTAEKDSIRWQEDDFLRLNTNFYSNTGAVGITNTKLFKNKSYLKTALVFSGTENGYKQDKLSDDYASLTREYEQRFLQNKLTLSSTYTQKINAKNNIRTGFILNHLGYRLKQSDMGDSTVLLEQINEKGGTETMQVFFQWNSHITEKLTANVGIHYFQLFLNNSNSLEPRASLRYDIRPKHHLTLGYGLHSQLQPIGVYFVEHTENGTTTLPNRNLKLSKAHHIVLGYDFVLNEHEHIKTEVYYQHLFHVPISQDPTSTYSILNSQNGFPSEMLTNSGLGKNYGLELTYERFLFKNLYYLLSASLYESKYRAADGNWYDTQFNTNYATSLTIGKEWNLKSRKHKNRSIGFNIKTIYVGGFRYTPIDLNASIAAGETKFVTSQTYGKRMPDYYRLDIRLSLKRNYKRLTSTVALDIQNTTNRKNVGGQYFDEKTGNVKYWYQSPLLPILSYRLEF
ncbi:TonB-dependent receptor [Fluviicola sp.]|uniref:TonB-dependent receptor n=1 Tax=Fluviicola sp. TaxID=1917219 RepID=UPI00262D3D09|nr:TonB-dependent receptor [Fluviicola sp.]